MAKLLSASAFAQYHRDEFYVPIRVLSREEAAGYRRRLETYEAERGGAIGGELRHKTHLLFTWLDRLVRHPRILDAVEDVLGPTSCAGARASSSRRRTMRRTSPGTRTRPTGA